MKLIKLVPSYVILLAISILFVFPFYWVVVSSLESISGLNLKPPAMYPAELKTMNGRLSLIGHTYMDGKDRWVELSQSRALIGKSKGTGSGGYFLKLEQKSVLSNYTPTQLVRWLPSQSLLKGKAKLTLIEPQETTLILSKLPIETVNGRSMAILAKQIRGSGSNFHELLFCVSSRQSDIHRSSIQTFVDPIHTRQLVFHAKWSNYLATLKGPEATIGGQSNGFLLFMRNSLFLATFAVIAQIASSSLVAFAFARLRFKGRDPLFLVLLATLMIPSQVTLIPLFFIFRSLHWVNTFLPLMVPQLTAGAFNVFLIRQFLLNFPKELDESATIDGATSWQIYRRIVLPNCGPVLIVVGLFTFIASWQDVLGPLIYLDSPRYRTVTLGLEYFQSPYVDNRPLLLAGAVLSILPVFFLFLIAQRYILSGIATTGLKS